MTSSNTTCISKMKKKHFIKVMFPVIVIIMLILILKKALTKGSNIKGNVHKFIGLLIFSKR